MVLSDLFRPGDDGRGLLKYILATLRDFDLIHKKDLEISEYGMVDLIKHKIYIKKHEGFEDDDSFLHELRHIFRNLYHRNPDFDKEMHEIDALIGSALWYRNIYKDLEK